jgi:hypothetical protein
MLPLAERKNKFRIETRAVMPDQAASLLPAQTADAIAAVAGRIALARKNGRPVICATGAHSIKNGLGPVFGRLIERRTLTHLATNGAGIIHDWEFSFLGQSSEDVRQMVHEGQFGNWHETGFFINLAINLGALEGKGYGESVGAMIERERLDIPSAADLERVVRDSLARDPLRSAAAADLLHMVRTFNLPAGTMAIPHQWKRYSAQAAACRAGVPFTGHPMIGHDIIYNHPMNHGAAIGRCAQRDFLAYAQSVSDIEDGVYLSIGSAIMSPMIFEKSLSMAQNIAIQAGRHIDRHHIVVVDLAECAWDWSRGEPPENNPAYYLRYNKTFARMGGTMQYIQCDNRDFLLALLQNLEGKA